MFSIVTAIILTVFATFCLTLIIVGCLRRPIKEYFSYTIPKLLVVCVIVFTIIAINLFNIGIDNIQSDAIDHYVVGDVEKVEIFQDGELVDWYYKVIDVDYD